MNISYAHSGTQNNGKITWETDALSGEQVLYTYDSLNRLASAQTAGAGGWGQSYTYDGFGNLTDQTLIKGTAPDVHVAYNYLTNRQTGDTADANGNIGSTNVYDIDNRLVQPSSGAAGLYAYDPSNKRVWRWNASGLDELTFWAGQKLATYQISVDGGGVWFTLTSTNVNFGGKLVSKGTYNSSGTGDKVSLTPVVADRLGSIGKFYPYGVERPSATQNDKEKFTGYFRDASTGLDYADQRYEQPGMGRFMTPDPYGRSAKATNPGSWNRYAYVGGDPVNHVDPTGQDWSDWVSGWDPYYNEWWGGNTGDGGYEFDVASFISTILATFYNNLHDTYGEFTDDFVQGHPFGWNGARNALGKVTCFTLLGFDSADAARDFYDNIIKFRTVHDGPLQLDADGEPGLESPPPAAANPETNTIFINYDYNWFNFSATPVQGGGTFDYLSWENNRLGTNLSKGSLANYLILQQLAKLRAATDLVADTEKFAHDLYNDCIKQ